MLASGNILQMAAKTASSHDAYAIKNRDRVHVHHTRIKYANRGTSPPSIFPPGDKVLMQDHIRKKWTHPVKILEVRSDVTSYVVKAKNGREYIHSNRFL